MDESVLKIDESVLKIDESVLKIDGSVLKIDHMDCDKREEDLTLKLLLISG